MLHNLKVRHDVRASACSASTVKINEATQDSRCPSDLPRGSISPRTARLRVSYLTPSIPHKRIQQKYTKFTASVVNVPTLCDTSLSFLAYPPPALLQLTVYLL